MSIKLTGDLCCTLQDSWSNLIQIQFAGEESWVEVVGKVNHKLEIVTLVERGFFERLFSWHWRTKYKITQDKKGTKVWMSYGKRGG